MPKKTGDKNNKNNSKDKKQTLRKKTTHISFRQIKSKQYENTPNRKTAKNINLFQSNESIIKVLLDKIINLSVRKANINAILNKVPDSYFYYLQNQINTMLSTSNIFYSDEPETPDINLCSFWKTDYNKCNTWVEITEPNSIKVDRYENAFINYFDVKKNVNNENKNKVLSPISDNENSISIINKEQNKKSKTRKNSINNLSLNLKNIDIKKNKNNLDVLEENSSSDSVDVPKVYSKRNNVSKIINSNDINNNNKNKLSSRNNLNPLNNNSPLIKKRSKYEILEFPSKEIPGINDEFNHEKYDPPNINFLRKEKEDLKMKRVKDQKKYHFISQKTMKNLIKDEIEDDPKDVKNTKIFDSNKLTFDSNGTIISFKPLKMDISSNDFAVLKNSVKIFNTKRRRSTINKKPKKNDEINDLLKEKEKENEKGKDKTENIIKNPADDPNGFLRNQYKKIIPEKNEKIIPSGSNFSLILPNIGVILKEDDQIKKGTRDFGKYFNKYSLEDYDKILKDYVPFQNKTMMMNKMADISKSPLNKSINKQYPNSPNIKNNNLLLSPLKRNSSVIINNNSELSNPLINQDKENTSIQNDINNNNIINLKNQFKINKNSFNNSLLSSNTILNNFSMSKNISNITTGRFDGSIRLNKEGISSLKVELDSLQDLDIHNKNNYYSPKGTGMKNINVLSKNYKNIFKKINIENNKMKDLNDFNKKIITNSGWGRKSITKSMSSGNFLFSKHQTKYQAIREFGNNILNKIKVKLPRNRKVNLQI